MNALQSATVRVNSLAGWCLPFMIKIKSYVNLQLPHVNLTGFLEFLV